MNTCCLCAIRATSALVPGNLTRLFEAVKTQSVPKTHLYCHDDISSKVPNNTYSSYQRHIIQSAYHIAYKVDRTCDLTVHFNLTQRFIPSVFLLGESDSVIRELISEHYEPESGSILNVHFDTDDSTIPLHPMEGYPQAERDSYSGVVLGGTFDRLHAGHKILISVAALFAERTFVIGVTDDDYVRRKKSLPELIEPCEKRVERVTQFVREIRPDLNLIIRAMSDGFGPSIEEDDLQLIVVSAETTAGGRAVSEKRKQLGLSAVEVLPVSLATDPAAEKSDVLESKISSSNMRKNILGTRLRQPRLAKSPGRPYVIGLTGGIASGKSSVCRKLQSAGRSGGISVVDCDKLGHAAYLPGSDCLKELVREFGEGIMDESGVTVDRKVLGSIVFSDQQKLKLLNRIVWPYIRRAAEAEIAELSGRCEVVVLDAAVLLEAGWDDLCNDVWVCIIPPEEAAARIQVRNPSLTDEDARRRIACQMSNFERVEQANVVLCTLWSHEFTSTQIERALATI